MTAVGALQNYNDHFVAQRLDSKSKMTIEERRRYERSREEFARGQPEVMKAYDEYARYSTGTRAKSPGEFMTDVLGREFYMASSYTDTLTKAKTMRDLYDQGLLASPPPRPPSSPTRSKLLLLLKA